MIGVKGTEIFLQFESGTWGGGYFLGQISPVSILWLQYGMNITERCIVLAQYNTHLYRHVEKNS